MKNNYLYLFKKLATSKNRKSLPRIFVEFLHLSFIRKEIATYYFTAFAYVNNMKYKTFYSHRNLIPTSIFESKDKLILDDKNIFSEWANKFNITTPQSIMLSNIEQIDEKLDLHVEEKQDFFLKPVDDLCGNKCFKINKANKTKLKEFILNNYDENESILVQELVDQHNFTKKLNSSSLNTMRVHTLNTDGKIKIISAYMRIGKRGHDVDNIAQGGYLCKVDIDSWELEEICVTHFPRNPKVIRLDEITEKKLDSYTIPFKEKSKRMILKAAKNLNTTLVGWDLALTQNGPILIEGNSNPEMNYFQYSMDGFANDLDVYNFMKDKLLEIGSNDWD